MKKETSRVKEVPIKDCNSVIRPVKPAGTTEQASASELRRAKVSRGELKHTLRRIQEGPGKHKQAQASASKNPGKSKWASMSPGEPKQGLRLKRRCGSHVCEGSRSVSSCRYGPTL